MFSTTDFDSVSSSSNLEESTTIKDMDIAKELKNFLDIIPVQKLDKVLSRIKVSKEPEDLVENYMILTENSTIAENMKPAKEMLDGVLYDKAILKEIGDKPFYELKVISTKFDKNSEPVSLTWSNIPGFELYGVPYQPELRLMLRTLQYDLCEVLEYETAEKLIYWTLITRFRYTKE